MKRRLPDFVIIGAMKCATTTLHEQLARQSGFAMSLPKEPNFFSDDAIFAKGLDWYSSVFENAPEQALVGESSTHYSKLPAHPKSVERMVAHLPDVKLVYVMRHPVDRLVSHYWHDFLDGRIQSSINDALDTHTDLIDFGRYAMQLKPYFEAYGPERVHPIFFERLVEEPQAELERLCDFLGHEGRASWDFDLKPLNVGVERMRQSRFRQALVNDPVLGPIRRLLLPKSLVDRAKDFWRVKHDRPTLSETSLKRLEAVFDEDLATLGSWLGANLSCRNFREIALSEPAIWTGLESRGTPQAECSIF